MELQLETNGARAVIGTDGAVWNANEAFCSLVRLDEPALRHLGWRQLVHSADRRYVAAHLVEVLAGDAHLREFDVRLVPPDGRDGVPARLRVELVRDGDGRQGWFLVEAWATT
jgi:PAS domain-containing protein